MRMKRQRVCTIAMIVGARGQLAEGAGWCVGVLTYLSWFLIFITLPFSLCVCLKVNPILSVNVNQCDLRIVIYIK